MVGTRDVSQYGAKMARHLAESASYSKWTTVSGIAIGVDTVVHRATVDAGGITLAVLGGGLAHFHPQENLKLAKDIVFFKNRIELCPSISVGERVNSQL